MMEPIRVWELEAGRPNHHVPRFQRIAAIRREDHGEAGALIDVENQFNRQQRQDGERDGAGRGEHADQVPDAGPDDGNLRLERVGVDDGGDGVGRVVESVDKLKAKGDDQGEAQQDIGPGGERVDAREVVRQLRAGVEEAGYENQSENKKTNPAVRFLSGLIKKRACRDLLRSNCDRYAFIHKGKNAVKNIVGAAERSAKLLTGVTRGESSG